MRLGLHVEIAGDRKPAVEHLPDRKLADRLAARRFTHGAQCGREFVDIVIVGHIARLEMDFGDTAVIAGCQAIEDFGKPQPRLPVDPSHDTEIDRDDTAIRADEQIPLMHVGMEKAFGNRLTQEGEHKPFGYFGPIMPCGLDRGDIGNLDPVNPFECHHPAGGAVPVDCGDIIALDCRHRLLEFGRGGGLTPQVQLAQGPALEIGDHQLRSQPGRFTAHGFKMGRRPLIGFDVAGKLFANAGAQDFYGDFAAVAGARTMHLGNRCGTDRIRIDMLEQFGRWPVQALVDFLVNTVIFFGRQRILQRQQIAYSIFANKIGAGGQCLPQFNRSRPDFAKGTRIIRNARLDRADAGNAAQTLDLGWGVAIILYAAQRAMACENAAPF